MIIKGNHLCPEYIKYNLAKNKSTTFTEGIYTETFKNEKYEQIVCVQKNTGL